MAYIQADMPFYLIGGSLDAKQNFPTIITMKEANEEDFGKTALCTNDEDGCIYVFNINNSVDPDTGKWRKFTGEGGVNFEEFDEAVVYTTGKMVIYDHCLYEKLEEETPVAEPFDESKWKLLIGYKPEPEPIYEDNKAYFTLNDVGITEVGFLLGVTSNETTISVTDGKGVIDLTDATRISATATASMYVKNLIVNKALSVKEIDFCYAAIETIEIVECNELQKVLLFDSPIALNKEQLIKIANSLPDRNNRALGSVILGYDTPPYDVSAKSLSKEVEPLYIAKDWYFGSALRLTNYSAFPSYIKQTGVLDIWESAEYGEGAVMACIDLGFSPSLKVSSSAQWLYPLNTSKQAGTDTDPVPIPTDSTLSLSSRNHGNLAQNFIIANPDPSVQDDMHWGVAPKAKIIPIKVADADCGGIDVDDYIKAFKHVYEHADELTSVGLPVSLGYEPPEFNDYENELIQVIKDIFDGTEVSVISSSENIDNNSYPYSLDMMQYVKGTVGVGASNAAGTDVFSATCKIPTMDVLVLGENVKYIAADGTSGNSKGCSGPCDIINGIMGLITILLTKKLGRKPTRQEKEDFLVKRTVPVANKDRDLVGNGIFNFMAYNENAYKSTGGVLFDEEV